MKIILTFLGLNFLYRILKDYFKSDSLISAEGWEILSCPLKKQKLRDAISFYHKTGSWEKLEFIN